MSSRDPVVPNNTAELLHHFNEVRELHLHKYSTGNQSGWKLAFRNTHKCGTDECAFLVLG